MGIVKGLKNINAHVDAEEAKFAGRGSDGPKTEWFKLADKQAVKVVFLQELDEDAKNFSKKNGLGFLAVEHANPKDFKRKALCSIDEEGACWACEQHAKDWKAGWKQKTRLYINALVDNGKDEPFVVVLSQGNGPKSITPSLIEYAGVGSITDKWYKIKRNGAGLSDTSYLMLPMEEHDVNVEDYELFDLDKVVRTVPYAQQEAHYLSTGGAPTEEVAEEAKSDDEEW